MTVVVYRERPKDIWWIRKRSVTIFRAGVQNQEHAKNAQTPVVIFQLAPCYPVKSGRRNFNDVWYFFWPWLFRIWFWDHAISSKNSLWWYFLWKFKHWLFVESIIDHFLLPRQGVKRSVIKMAWIIFCIFFQNKWLLQSYEELWSFGFIISVHGAHFFRVDKNFKNVEKSFYATWITFSLHKTVKNAENALLWVIGHYNRLSGSRNLHASFSKIWPYLLVICLGLA